MFKNDNFVGVGNLILQTYHWTVPSPKAKLLIIHGISEYAARYKEAAEYFNNQNFEVLSFDHRGHGKSQGKFGYIDRFEYLVNDLISFISRFNTPTTPLFIWGHSLGGLIAVSYMLEYDIVPVNFKGILLSAPALKISSDTVPLLQKLSGVLSIIAPKLKTIKLEIENISRDTNVVEKYKMDPLIYTDGLYIRSGAEVIKKIKVITALFPKFSAPLLLMHGESDKIVEMESSIQFFDQIKSEDKTLKIWPDAFHELTRDICKNDVLEMMSDWISKRV